MKKLNKLLFSLVAPLIDGDKEGGAQLDALAAERCDEKTLRAVFNLAKRHDLGHLIAAGVRGAKYKMQNSDRKTEAVKGDGSPAAVCSEELFAELEKAEMTAVWRVRNIENEQGRVKKCLEEAKIPFILLKGAVLRGYYPESWMRTSSDIDVLVPINERDRAIKTVTDGLGYRISTVEINDASLYARSGVHLDMHTLFEGEREDCGLLDAAWREASTNGGYEHLLTPEHFYFYHVAHMAEHMRHGGCGIRPFIDLYLIRSHIHTDSEKLSHMLAEYGLDRFDRAVTELSLAWMHGTDTAGLKALEEYVLTGGVYGSVEQGVAANRRGGQGKFSYIMRRIFMPYSELKKRHPRLDGRPWLTPFFEVYRWCSLIVPKRFKRSRAELKGAVRINSEKVDSVAALLDSLGI